MIAALLWGGGVMSGRPEMPLILRRPYSAFKDHAASCTKCGQVDLGRTATLALACLTGSLLLKDAANETWNADRGKRARRQEATS